MKWSKYNQNLNYYNSTLHEYVNDVYKKYPDQNWWIFYQNIKPNKTITTQKGFSYASATLFPTHLYVKGVLKWKLL